jgi:3-oxoacyl-[acyl-carrier protein] reductase
VNLRGTFLASREFVRRTSAGRIINIASDLGLLGREEMAAYTASKGAIIALNRTLARELAPGILVNAIAPGSIETDMTSPANMSPEQLARDMATPLARFGQPEEIAAMALYLAGPDSSFVTGQCFGVNGGSVML